MKQDSAVLTSCFSDEGLHKDLATIPDALRKKDMNAKNILRYRRVLAWILKTAVSDFKNMNPDDIYDAIVPDATNS